jgi:alcohol dehydrogenase (cytochrome c)
VWNGIVYAGSYSGRFYAFDAATGVQRWSFQAKGPISGSATVVGDIVYFATLKQQTYALNARTGKLVWSFHDGAYTPVVAASGRLFLVGYSIVYGMVPR